MALSRNVDALFTAAGDIIPSSADATDWQNVWILDQGLTWVVACGAQG
jgi:hypothetical protein